MGLLLESDMIFLKISGDDSLVEGTTIVQLTG